MESLFSNKVFNFFRESPSAFPLDFDIWNYVFLFVLKFLGCLGRQLLKVIKCEVCREAIVIPKTISENPNAELTNQKTRGKLIHPNTHLFNMIMHLENYFNKYCYDVDAYNLIIDDMICSYNFSFPCTEHGNSFLSYAMHYYVRMRMRQFTRQLNSNSLKESREKKKQAKFHKH